MAGEKPILVEGTVVEQFPNATFRVRLSNGHEFLAHVSGKMKPTLGKSLPGDHVMIEMSPFDLSTGRIIYRTQTPKPQP